MKPSKIVFYSAILFSVFFSALFILIGTVNAVDSASLYLAPSSGTYTVGNTFSVEVKVNTGGLAINAADGTIVFNTNNLEVKSISKTGSIFTLWVQEPVFSNPLGTINFAGGKPSPGYTGASGTILTITFFVKTAGTGNLAFASGSVLADDGKGTNVLSSLGSASYTLIGKQITPIVPGEEGGTGTKAPSAPVVSSPTHPEEDKWYSNNDPEFTWKLPSGATGVSLLLHQSPTADPGSDSEGLIDSKKYTDVADGIWYFHIKLKNQYGWGDITHRKVLIDTGSPKPFEVIIENGGDDTNPSPALYFQTEDSISGVDYYEIRLNDIAVASTTEPGLVDSPYYLPPQAAGKYVLEVRAYDKSGNFSQAKGELEIVSIKTPKITKIPRSIRIGDVLTVEGEAEPQIAVRIYIKIAEKEPFFEKVDANLAGKFVLNYEKVLAKGDYLVWAQAEDERGALSSPTKKYELTVGLPPFLKFGKIALDYLTTMITLIILIIGAIAVILYTWYRVSMWRKRLRKETKEVSQSVAGAFRALREEVEEEIAMLDKKPGLTKEEKAIRDKLQEALDISEKFITKEIGDVEKELE